MTRFGWQALLLIPLLVVIYGLARSLRAGTGVRARAPWARFLVVSLLFHAGLLFSLDLVLVAIPVVEAHKELIESVVMKTFSITPTGRGRSAPSWEALPDGPPPAAPPVKPAATRPGSGNDLPFDPELKGIAPTITDAQARALPPARVVFLPRPNPVASDLPPSALPRTLAALPELPAPELPRLDRVEPAPEPSPSPPPVAVSRTNPDPRPASSPDPAVPPFAPRADAFDPLPPATPALGPDRGPAADLARLLPARRFEDPADAPPDAPRPPIASRPVPSPEIEAPAPLPRRVARDVELAQGPVPPLRVGPRPDPPLRSTPSSLPPPRPDVPPPPLPAMRLPPPDPAVALVIAPAEPLATFSLRPAEVRKDLVAAMGGTAASEAAVDRGLAWLVAHQAAAGNWSLEDLHCQGHKCDAAGSGKSDGAATGLALMALLGAGHSPTKGAHAASVRRGVDWLVAHQRPDGCLVTADGSLMYGHGFATIALCEALGLGADPALRGPSERAIKFIVDAQDPNTGGWRYQPRGGGDTSVFGWQLMALKSAEMAGLAVPADSFRLATRWLDAVATGPGKTLYGYQPGREARPSLTAEALLCRQYLGASRTAGPMAAGGLYLRANLPKWDARNSYYWYYATQVMYHLQGEDWVAWNGKLRDMLVEAQAKDGPSAGSWHPQKPAADKWGEQGGRVYETALSLLILEVYYRHLPLYQQLSDLAPADPH